tara:strand:- start:415 stop:945 length:531 start_codon:yes stop_codon:yes gene_type:complete
MRNNQQSRNVVLTGFMGSGKSTVGVILAGKLVKEFVDTDTIIEQMYGAIPEIFKSEGEDAFRRYEREVSEQLALKENLVIATGGKLLLDQTNAELLGSSGRIFCLSAPVDQIIERILKDGLSERPLLDSEDFEEQLKEIYYQRAASYASFEQVDTAGRAPSEIASEIRDLLLPENK